MKETAKTHKAPWICTHFKHNKDATGARDSLRRYDYCVPSFEITPAPAAQMADDPTGDLAVTDTVGRLAGTLTANVEQSSS